MRCRWKISSNRPVHPVNRDVLRRKGPGFGRGEEVLGKEGSWDGNTNLPAEQTLEFACHQVTLPPSSFLTTKFIYCVHGTNLSRLHLNTSHLLLQCTEDWCLEAVDWLMGRDTMFSMHESGMPCRQLQTTWQKDAIGLARHIMLWSAKTVCPRSCGNKTKHRHVMLLPEHYRLFQTLDTRVLAT